MRFLITVFLSFTVLASADSFVLQPGPEGKDTTITDMYPGTNFGDAINLDMGSFVGEYRILIEWNIAEIPDGATVTNAVMELYPYASGGTETGEPRFYLVTEPWDEGLVAWDSQPAYDPGAYVAGEWTPVGNWLSLNLTGFVTGWHTGEYSNCGVIGIGSATGYVMSYWSSDYPDVPAQRPKLTVEFTPGDAAVAPSSLGAVKAVYR
jgi:hypothetical protein